MDAEPHAIRSKKAVLMRPLLKKLARRQRHQLQQRTLPKKNRNRRAFAKLAGRTGLGLRAWRMLRTLLPE